MLRAFLAVLVASGCGPSWVVDVERADPGFLGVLALGGGEAWVVGGLEPSGRGSIRHRTPDGWANVDSGVEAPLWWVTQANDGTLWVGGERGVVLRGGAGGFERVATPSVSATVFGVWVSAAGSVWAVGGDGSAGAFIWRSTGGEFTAQALPDRVTVRDTIYKVWGRADDDVWFVGSDGLVLRWDGTALAPVATGTNATLFTVHGDASRTLAVGGALGGAVLLSYEAGTWTDRSPPVDGLFGVAATPSLAIAVGQQRTIVESSGGDFAAVPGMGGGTETLHAVSVAPDGDEAFAVGGVIAAAPYLRGLVLRRVR